LSKTTNTAQVQMHNWDQELYLPGSDIDLHLSWVQMTLGTKVVFVHPCFSEFCAFAVTIGIDSVPFFSFEVLSLFRTAQSRVTAVVCGGHDLRFVMGTGIS